MSNSEILLTDVSYFESGQRTYGTGKQIDGSKVNLEAAHSTLATRQVNRLKIKKLFTTVPKFCLVRKQSHGGYTYYL